MVFLRPCIQSWKAALVKQCKYNRTLRYYTLFSTKITCRISNINSIMGIFSPFTRRRFVNFTCFNFRLCIESLQGQMWEVSPGSESVRLLAREAENSTSGWGSFWERSPLGSWCFYVGVPECSLNGSWEVRICGFKWNSSNLDRAPKKRDFVLLNSWDSFLVTLPSICSETWTT